MSATRALTVLISFVVGLSCLLLVQGVGFHMGSYASIAIAGTMAPDQSGGNSGSSAGQINGAAAPVSTPAPAAPGATMGPSGTVLASDNGSLFGTGSNADWTWGYVNNEYQIASTAPLAEKSHYEAIPQSDFSDVTVAVDAHLGSNGDPGSVYGVMCRYGSNSSGDAVSGYAFRVNSLSYLWTLSRIQPGGAQLSQGAVPGPVIDTATHHIVLTCQGTTITASVDGTQVATVQDSTYQHGGAGVWAYSSGESAGPRNRTGAVAGSNPGGIPTKVDDRFDNFVVTQP